MRPIIFASIVVALLALANPCAAKPKTQTLTIHVCESIDLYSGAIDAEHPATRIAEKCRDVTIKIARKAIAACEAQEIDTCEVLQSADKKTIMLESKILVSDDTIGGAT